MSKSDAVERKRLESEIKSLRADNDALNRELVDLAMRHEAPLLDFGKVDFRDSKYVRGKKVWYAATLYKYAEKQGLKPFRIPLAGFNLGGIGFEVTCMDSFVYHMKRCMDADTSYPVMLDDLGQLADGNHRIAKALLLNEKYIEAYRLTDMPAPDYYEEEEEDK